MIYSYCIVICTYLIIHYRDLHAIRDTTYTDNDTLLVYLIMITVIYVIYRFSAEFVSSCQVIQDHVSGSERENNSAVVSTNLL